MQAGFFEHGEPGVVHLREVPVPSLEGRMDGTCVVRGLYASLCGTDMLMIEQPRDIDWWAEREVARLMHCRPLICSLLKVLRNIGARSCRRGR